MKPHPLGLAKRRLYKQVWACSNAGAAGTEAHLAAVKSFHKAAWECFEARKVDPPQTKTEYQFNTGGACSAAMRGHKVEWDPRVKKAILAVERDCEFCWQELHRAVENWLDGTRAKIRALDALSKWTKDYNKRWDLWLARQKKLPAGIRKTKEFAEVHGQIHYVAGADGHFATAKEAEREARSMKGRIAFDAAMEEYNSPETQRVLELFEADRFDELQLALDTVDKESENDESED